MNIWLPDKLYGIYPFFCALSGIIMILNWSPFHFILGILLLIHFCKIISKRI